ncbi:hypothetical protein BSKO_00820 [Bryopsis sp. KO-2023]|nr:hypothetical protein BSKO_00820 [Bryopsis sp. KO-2023]
MDLSASIVSDRPSFVGLRRGSGFKRTAGCISKISRTQCRAHRVVGGERSELVLDGLARNFLVAAPLVGLALCPEAQSQELVSAGSSFSDVLYDVGQQMDALVTQQLTVVGPASFAIIYLAGLLTSLSPCTLSVLPLTIGYIGGYGNSEEEEKGAVGLFTRAGSFSAGLVTTLSLLGVASSLLGKAYGQFGSGLPIGVSLVAILMGLNLLELLPLEFPSLDVDIRELGLSPSLQAYLAGVTFAFAASPCSTPVLVTLLAYVSSTGEPVLGGGLLASYTAGYITPLLLVATATGAISQVMSFRKFSAWVTPASGVLLIGGGTYALLSRVLPA